MEVPNTRTHAHLPDGEKIKEKYDALALLEGRKKKYAYTPFFLGYALSCLFTVYPSLGLYGSLTWMIAVAVFLAGRQVLIARHGSRSSIFWRWLYVGPVIFALLPIFSYSSLSETRLFILAVLLVWLVFVQTSLVYGFSAFQRFYNFSISLPLCGSLLLSGHPTAGATAVFVFFSALAEEFAARSLRENLLERARLSVENDTLLEELKGEVVKLEQKNRTTTSLIVSACHDLRQPAHSMGLMLEAIGHDFPRSMTRQNFESLRRNNFRLSEMLSTLMDLARLDSGKFSPTLQPLSVANLLAELKDQISPSITQKSISYTCAPTTAWVMSDVDLLRRILGNLLSNAIKYTDAEGSIAVHVEERLFSSLNCSSTEGEVFFHFSSHGGTRPFSSAKYLAISVTDTGIGIPRQMLPHVFEEYSRLDHSSEGLGIGLSVVKRGCQLLQHSFSLRSELGEGTTATIFLPVTPSRIIPPSYANYSDDESYELGIYDCPQIALIAILEDDVDARKSTSALLKKWGFKTASGGDVVELSNDLGQNIPDLLLMDFHIQGTNAIQALEALKLRGKTKNTSVLIITGDLSVSGLSGSSDHDTVMVLHKPLRGSKLKAAVVQLLERRHSVTSAE